MDHNRMVNETQNGMGTAHKIALTALLFAVALVLAAMENSFPPLLAPIQGIKLGLSNIVVMYALFFVGKGQAAAVAVLKGFFVFATRGMVAGLLSLTGGLSSLVVMILFLAFRKDKISYFLLSVLGAVFHNLGQYTAFYLLYPNVGIWVYIPLLLIAGVIAGAITAKLLSVIVPAFERLGLNKK